MLVTLFGKTKLTPEPLIYDRPETTNQDKPNYHTPEYNLKSALQKRPRPEFLHLTHFCNVLPISRTNTKKISTLSAHQWF